MKPFDELLVWRDPIARSGPECMAVDELLLKNTEATPVLRIYDWDGDWLSVGYFGDMQIAKKSFPEGISAVRRWTGGGVVDHRHDLTYSLMIPRNYSVERMRGAASYQVIHQAVTEALEAVGVEAKMVTVDGGVESEQCFERPVAWDVVDATGRKLAGAGQRRTRWGLLHQGSVQVSRKGGFIKQLKTSLSEEIHDWEPSELLLEKAPTVALEKYADRH